MYDQTNGVGMLLPEAAGKDITTVSQQPRSLLYPCPGFLGDSRIVLQRPAYRGGGKCKFFGNIVDRNLFLLFHICNRLLKIAKNFKLR